MKNQKIKSESKNNKHLASSNDSRSRSQEVNEYRSALKEYGFSEKENETTASSRELQAFVYQRIAEVTEQLPEGSEISGRVFVVPRSGRRDSHRMRALFAIKTPVVEFEVIGESSDAYEAVNFAREATIDQLATLRGALKKAGVSDTVVSKEAMH